jgi:phosphoribosyl 1,2-cyclic phosphate phosphodiesterase
LRMTHSFMHLTVDEAVEFSRKVGAEHTWLIHTSHELEYETVNAYLPQNVRMAYDGLSLQFHGEVADGLS